MVPERDREELYDEYMLEKEKQEKEAAIQARRENMKKFREKLEKDPSININSQWRKVGYDHVKYSNSKPR